MSGGWDDVDRVAGRHDATDYWWVAAPGEAHSRRAGALSSVQRLADPLLPKTQQVTPPEATVLRKFQ
jgi:hypothetical protein